MNTPTPPPTAAWLDAVPTLAPGVEFYPFDRGTVLVEQPRYGHQVRISPVAHGLLELVDGRRTVAELTDELRQRHGVSLPPAEVYRLLFGRLAAYGIVESDQPVAARRGDAYLRLRVPLFSERWVAHLSRPLRFLFHPRWFYALYAAMLVFLTALLLYRHSLTAFYQSITLQSTGLFYGVFLCSALLHELGHATACRRFGAKPGSIGFGFYLFTPVLYADVSSAWKLPPAQRVIIDLAGIYMELLFCTALGLTFLLTQNYLFLNVSLVVMATTYINLNPLLRFDGYWATSDLLRVPNLRATSNRHLLAALKWAVGRGPQPVRSVLDGFLVGYALASWAFIALFLVGVLVYSPRSVVYFPYDAYRFFEKLISGNQPVAFEWVKQEVFGLLLPIVFYVTVFNLVLKRLWAWAKAYPWPEWTGLNRPRVGLSAKPKPV